MRDRHPFDLLAGIVDYEQGLLGPDEVVDLARALYRTGLWRHLQGHYGRLVEGLVRSGEIA